MSIVPINVQNKIQRMPEYDVLVANVPKNVNCDKSKEEIFITLENIKALFWNRLVFLWGWAEVSDPKDFNDTNAHPFARAQNWFLTNQSRVSTEVKDCKLPEVIFMHIFTYSCSED